jgi:hypothetical protein
VSTGKIVLLVFGIIFLLVSVGLLLGGAALVWANSSLTDSEGFFTTEVRQIERDSYAIVTEPVDIDLEAGWHWGWHWDWSNFVTFKVEGYNNNPSKQIFIGVAEESDVRAYLSGVEYDEITEWSIHPYRVEYTHHLGGSVPTAPTTQTFWAESAHGAGTQTLEWEPETGNWMLVLMNDDGSAGVSLSGAVGVKVPWLFGIGVGFLVGGIAVLIIGIVMVYFAVRRP